MKQVTRRLLVAAGAAVGATGLLYGAGEFLFRFTIDTQFPWSMMKLVKTGRVKGADLAGAHHDADEETEAARWFAESKQPVTTFSNDGLKLHGWLLDPDCVNPKPHLYAICVHGYTGVPDEMAKYAHRFARLGFTVLAPAMRGHELSQGRYTGMGWLERRDLMAWIRLIVESDPDARILLDGLSMGAACVMMTVGEPDLPRNVVAAIEDCGYSSVWDQFLYNAKGMYHLPNKFLAMPIVETMSMACRRTAGYGFKEASSVASLKRATIPMLFIHGDADTFVDPSFLSRNYEACASIHRERLLIPGAGHAMSASTAPDLYWRKVTRFVRDTFEL
ncbi:alpha/beta hydrolase [Bifidobacterium hapali]|uniref:Alpha/beta hydrolase n=2 Tax=Bifidobacterium hapali TaxID=1630172 RepID=A0A261FYS3_9BIFI|nr:alpha/beta hydrolase [Bifidobacterium hapali]